MSRKGENIYKRKDGRWEGRYIIERIPHKKAKYGYVYARSYREVKEKLLMAKSALPIPKINADVGRDEITVQQICEEWIQKKSTEIKPSTVVKYQISLEYYVYPFIGTQSVAGLHKKMLEEYVATLLTSGKKDSTGLSAKTAADIISILRNVLRYASEHNCNVDVSACDIKIRQKAKTLQVLNQSDQKILRDYLTDHMNLRNLGIMICLFTGMRIGEICALRWENISIEQRHIYVCQTLQRLPVIYKTKEEGVGQPKTTISITRPKSACSIRIIPIPEQLSIIMADYEQKEGFLLTGTADKYVEPRSLQNHYKKVLENCGIKRTNFHVLRHTFATRCVEIGFDIKSLSEILGHASVNITMNRYVHPSMDLKRINMEKLNELLAVR